MWAMNYQKNLQDLQVAAAMGARPDRKTRQTAAACPRCPHEQSNRPHAIDIGHQTSREYDTVSETERFRCISLTLQNSADVIIIQLERLHPFYTRFVS